MNKTNIITTATTSNSLNPNSQATKDSLLNDNRLLPTQPKASQLRNWAVMVACVLALVALNAKADQESTVQDNTLVAGTLRPDPRIRDSQIFVLEPSPGVSVVSGNFEERGRYIVRPANGANSLSAVVTGNTIRTYPNGDQLYLQFRGTMNIPRQSSGTLPAPAAVQGNVTVLGGTGAYAAAHGQGFAMGMLASEGRFSLRTDLTLTSPSGEKDK